MGDLSDFCKTEVYTKLQGSDRRKAVNYLVKRLGHPDEGSDFDKNMSWKKMLFRMPKINRTLGHLGMWYLTVQKGYDALILSKEGKIIGYTAFQMHPDKSLHVFSIEVDEDHRENGLGTLMQTEIIRKARQRKLKKVRIGAGGDEATNRICRTLSKRGEELGISYSDPGWFEIKTDIYTLERSKLDIEDGIHYKVVSPFRPEGDATLIFRPFNDEIELIFEEYHDTLSREGLNPEDVVADITYFYPNGENNKPCMRQGVGSQVLAAITEDALARNAKALIVMTNSDSMAGFLEKHNFTPVSDGYHYYKLLE